MKKKDLYFEEGSKKLKRLNKTDNKSVQEKTRGEEQLRHAKGKSK